MSQHADSLAGPFWTAMTMGKLTLPRCTGCSRLHFYPRIACPNCGEGEFDWIESAGRGVIYSYTIVAKPKNAPPEAEAAAIVIVALDEGPHLLTTVTDHTAQPLAIGQAVELDLPASANNDGLPMFRRMQ
jgi:uncharacterized OB-fold protein